MRQRLATMVEYLMLYCYALTIPHWSTVMRTWLITAGAAIAGLAGLSTLALPTRSLAQDKAPPTKAEQPDAHRQLGAHAHGQGKLNIAFEGRRIEMELEAPAADIVGFEHAARTPEQRTAIAKARAVLAKPLALFVLPAAAGCKVAEAKVRLIAGGHAHSHGHGHGHSHGKPGAKADDASAHSEFHAEYALTCAKPDLVQAIDFEYFKTFAGANELDVAIVAKKGQSKYKVTRDKPKLELTGMM